MLRARLISVFVFLWMLADFSYAFIDVFECRAGEDRRFCHLTADYALKKINDGWVAKAQGHARGTDGSISLGDSNEYINMQGHIIDLSCCNGRGVVVGGDVFSRGWASDIVVENGFIKSGSGAFTLGAAFKDPDTENFFATGKLSEGDELCKKSIQRARNLNFISMVLIGDSGDVGAVDSKIINSRILLSRINIIGSGLTFEGNEYEVIGGGEVVDPLRYESAAGRLVNAIGVGLPIIRNNEGWKSSKSSAYNPSAALYLSCADNATISNNIFTAKTKIPGAYAIILKHSKNVRITNNTFEGFTVPVLMDKYSSIIDDSGNIIKPDVTANDPDSKLYGLDVDISKLIKSKTKPWWKFWQ